MVKTQQDVSSERDKQWAILSQIPKDLCIIDRSMERSATTKWESVLYNIPNNIIQYIRYSLVPYESKGSNV